MSNIQSLRRLAVKLSPTGTVERVSQPFNVYKDSYGFILLQAYVPVTQSAGAGAICTVHRTAIDTAGERIAPGSKYSLMFSGTVDLDGFQYRVFERPMPKEFTDTEGELSVIFNYADIKDGKAINRLPTSTYTFPVTAGGWNDEGVEIDVTDAQAALINAHLIAIEGYVEQVEALTQPPDDSEAAAAVPTDISIAIDGRLKFDGIVPYVGANGMWWIGTVDTGIKARGDTGATGATGDTVQLYKALVAMTTSTNSVAKTLLYVGLSQRQPKPNDYVISSDGLLFKLNMDLGADWYLAYMANLKGDVGYSIFYATGSYTVATRTINLANVYKYGRTVRASDFIIANSLLFFVEEATAEAATVSLMFNLKGDSSATAYVFDTYADMAAWLAVPENVALLEKGDNLYIIALDTPDYWWDGTQIQILETTKVDLTGFAKVADLTALNNRVTAVEGQIGDIVALMEAL